MVTRKKSAANTSPTTVDEYLAGAPAEKRVALGKVRAAIKKAAPAAIEGIGYGIVGYKYKGRPLAYIGYWKDHCSLYGASDTLLEPLADQLKGYDISKGTIKFPPDKPLPERLVAKIVKARMAEIEAR